MQDLNYWKQFEHTGKVEDYLSYCACNACDMQEREQRKNVSEAQTVAAKQTGVNPYAGIHNSNGNRTETNAYR